MPKRSRPVVDDWDRIDSYLDRLPSYVYSAGFGAALLPTASAKQLRAACRKVGIHETFLMRDEYVRALETHEGLDRPLLKECRAAGIETEGLVGRTRILEALRNNAEEEDTCAICLDAYRMGDVVRTLLCSRDDTFHEFHASCIASACKEEYRETRAMPRCPLCRESIRHTEGVTQRRRFEEEERARL